MNKSKTNKEKKTKTKTKQNKTKQKQKQKNNENRKSLRINLRGLLIHHVKTRQGRYKPIDCLKTIDNYY